MNTSMNACMHAFKPSFTPDLDCQTRCSEPASQTEYSGTHCYSSQLPGLPSYKSTRNLSRLWLSTHRSPWLDYVMLARPMIEIKVDNDLVAVGGTAGYLRTKSKPSLVAGLGLGASYALAVRIFWSIGEQWSLADAHRDI